MSNTKRNVTNPNGVTMTVDQAAVISSATHSSMGYLANPPVLGSAANNVHRLTPEVQRDAYGSYLSGDRSPAMALAKIGRAHV